MVSKGADTVVLWPHYFDSRLSRAEGRRVKNELAVKDPDAKWVEVAAKRAGFATTLEEDARHPSAPGEKVGRVLITKKGPKEGILDEVASKMREAQDARKA